MARLLIAALVLLLAGCRERVTQLPPMPPPDQPPHFESKPDGAAPWKVEGALLPNQPIVKIPTRVLLTIVDAEGKPVEGAKVHGRPWMPLMGHGDGEINFTQGRNRIWSGETTLNMAGDWDIYLTIEAGGQTAKHTLSFVAREGPGGN
jgi:hypothetical protein